MPTDDMMYICGLKIYQKYILMDDYHNLCTVVPTNMRIHSIFQLIASIRGQEQLSGAAQYEKIADAARASAFDGPARHDSQPRGLASQLRGSSSPLSDSRSIS